MLVLGRDLKPGMRMARVNANLDTVYVEIGQVLQLKGRAAYKIYSADWLEGSRPIAADPARKHLAPFILLARKKLEIQD